MVNKFNIAKFRLWNQDSLNVYAQKPFKQYQGIMSVCGVVRNDIWDMPTRQYSDNEDYKIETSWESLAEKDEPFKAFYNNTQTLESMSGGCVYQWTFDPSSTDPIATIIGVHTGYDRVQQLNFGLFFHTVENLVRMFKSAVPLCPTRTNQAQEEEEKKSNEFHAFKNILALTAESMDNEQLDTEVQPPAEAQLQ